MGMTYGEAYLRVRDGLIPTGDPVDAGMMARDLVCTLSGFRTEQFLMRRDEQIPATLWEKIENGVERLKQGEPLAYVLGEWEFYGLPMYVTKDVLIPRDDTCAVAELAIGQGLFLENGPRVLDLCTGSGCIGIAVASRLRDARVTLIDISQEAIAVAKRNIARNKMGGRISCVRADAARPAPEFLGKFDMIVSNPPYITASEMEELPDSVRNYEPHLALYGGTDGLDFYREIVRNYTKVLKPKGYLCFEFGMGQGEAVCQILADGGFRILERKKDNCGVERAVLAQFDGKGD